MGDYKMLAELTVNICPPLSAGLSYSTLARGFNDRRSHDPIGLDLLPIIELLGP